MTTDWTEIRIVQLVHALASTVGMEKSRQAVYDAATQLGFTGETLTNEQALSVLDVIAGHEGILGITARFVKVRVECRRSLPSAPPPHSDPPPSGRMSLVDIDPLPTPDTGMATVFSRRMLANLLSGTLGREVAAVSVAEAADALALPRGTMTKDQALSLLEALANKPGVVGVTARFAKTRILLKQGE